LSCHCGSTFSIKIPTAHTILRTLRGLHLDSLNYSAK
jgi:hypothetical protein